jgi:hypothetical protein
MGAGFTCRREIALPALEDMALPKDGALVVTGALVEAPAAVLPR